MSNYRLWFEETLHFEIHIWKSEIEKSIRSTWSYRGRFWRERLRVAARWLSESYKKNKEKQIKRWKEKVRKINNHVSHKTITFEE